MELEALQPERSFTPKLKQRPLKKEKVIPLTPKFDPKERQRWWEIPKKKAKVFPVSRFEANKPSSPSLNVSKPEENKEKTPKLSLFHNKGEDDEDNLFSTHLLSGTHKEQEKEKEIFLTCGEEDGKDPGFPRTPTSKPKVKAKEERRNPISVVIPPTGKVGSDNKGRIMNLESEQRTLSPKENGSPSERLQLITDPQHKDQTQTQTQGKESETQKSQLSDVQIEDY